MPASTWTIVRSADRFVSKTPGIVTTHELSFGRHYDPARTSYGELVAHNIETVAAGHGFGPHRHRDVEIVTWVVAGRLQHDDDQGHEAELSAGWVARLSAGDGVEHSEVNADREEGGEPVTFVQLWFRRPESDDDGTVDYEAAAAATSGDSQWTVLAAGAPHRRERALLALRNRSVSVLHLQLPAGGHVLLPDALVLHVHALTNTVRLELEELAAGDSAVLHDATQLRLRAAAPAEALVVLMDETGDRGAG